MTFNKRRDEPISMENVTAKKNKLTQEDAGVLILLMAFIFGTFFKILPAWEAGFPINDGGMFYSMIQDLRASHYVIPAFTSYNGGDIPYTYPPLGFYLSAALTDLLNLPDPLEILRWVPGILNAFCIFSFYHFAKEVLDEKIKAQIATLIFAMTPHLASWWSMGGGLTRSLGVLFMLPSLTFIYRVLTKESRRDIWLAIFFSGLTVLSHSEASIYTAAIAILLWLMKSRNIRGLLQGLLIALGVLIFTAPWNMWVLHYHGLDPFLSAGRTGGTSSILGILNINIMTDELLVGLIAGLGLLSLAAQMAKGSYILPAMLLVIYMVNPRSGHTVGNIPMALASGIFLVDVIIPSILSNKKNGVVVFIGVLLPYLFTNFTYHSTQLAKYHLNGSERNAMEWISKNTQKESAFLVITGEANGFTDYSSEWFPALTGRKSIATLQGNEWLLGNQFMDFKNKTQHLQNCISSDLDCVMKNHGYLGRDFNYLYLPASAAMLANDLKNSPDFQLVYNEEGIIIFEKK